MFIAVISFQHINRLEQKGVAIKIIKVYDNFVFICVLCFLGGIFILFLSVVKNSVW